MASKLTGTGLKLPDTGELVQTKVVKSVSGIEPDATGNIELGGTSPTGSITMYAGTTAPSGWILCEGQDVSRTTYPDLFNVIGETYGNGNGTSTFTLPNLSGKSPLGSDSAGVIQYNTLGWNRYDVNESTPYTKYRLQTTVSQSSAFASHISYKMIKFFDDQGNDVSTDVSGVTITANSTGNGSGALINLNTRNFIEEAFSVNNWHNDYSTHGSSISLNYMYVEFEFPSSFSLGRVEIYGHINLEWKVQAEQSSSFVDLASFVTPEFINLDVGEQGGSSLHTLSELEMPRHSHKILDNFARTDRYMVLSSENYHPDNHVPEKTTEFTGGSSAHNNMHPYLVLGFIIKT